MTTVWDVRWVESTGSTNADAAAAARDGADEGLVIVADHQSAGRGRLDRRWDAPAGTSLAMSFLLRPAVAVARWPWLPLLAGVAVTDAVEKAAGVAPVLKWPNDVLLGGRKLAGILTERIETPQGPVAVVGIGLNVSQAADQLPPGAAALTGTAVSRADVFDAVAARLAEWYTSWRAAAGDPGAGLSAAYVARCDTLGRQVRAELPGGGALEGRAVGVDESGRLVIENVDGVNVVGAGDVVHIRLR